MVNTLLALLAVSSPAFAVMWWSERNRRVLSQQQCAWYMNRWSEQSDVVHRFIIGDADAKDE